MYDKQALSHGWQVLYYLKGQVRCFQVEAAEAGEGSKVTQFACFKRVLISA
jgi:hypothetical protein